MKSSKKNRGGMFLRGTVVLVAALTLSGCGTVRGWFGGNAEPGPTDPAPLLDFEPAVSVSRMWSASVGRGERRIGAGQGPAVADGRVYAAGLKGGVRAIDLYNGSVLWHHPSDLRLAGTPGVGDGLVVVGSLDGDVLALDAASGTERWRARVGNEVTAAPAVGQGMVIVRGNDGRVTGFDAASGERRWFWVRDLPVLAVRGNDAPVLGPGFVFVGNDDGSLVALSLAEGMPLWEQQVGQPEGRTELERMADLDGSPVLDDAVLFASSYRGQTMAIEAPSGRPLWLAERGTPARMAMAADRLLLADRNGAVVALDKYSGAVLWQAETLARRSPGSAVIHGEYAVFGDFQGYLHWIRLDSGQLAARTRAGRDPIKGSPVVANQVLVVQTVDGDLSAYRLDR